MLEVESIIKTRSPGENFLMERSKNVNAKIARDAERGL